MVLYRLLCFLLCFSLGLGAKASTEVNIALTSIQPPFVIDNEKQHGLIFDVVQALNVQQTDFVFTTKLYPAKRLLAKLTAFPVHMVAYNHINWGWKERGGLGSINLTSGRDLFFSLKNQEFLDEKLNTIGAVDGFHYAFADFDSKKLSKMENVTLSQDEDGVLKLVEHFRVHKGIASETYLNWIAKSRPELYSKLIVDKTNPDHSYSRQFVVFEPSPITVVQLNSLLMGLYNNGTLQTIYAKYGLTFPAPKVVLGK